MAPASPASRRLRGSPVERLQPRSIGRLIDGGFDVIRFRVRTVLTVNAVFLVPLVAVPQFLISRQVAGALADPVVDGPSLPEGWTPVGPLVPNLGTLSGSWWWLMSGPLLASAFCGVVTGHLVSGWFEGRDPGPWEVLRRTGRQTHVVLAAFLLALPLRGLGFLACWFGGLFSVGIFMVLSPVIAVEGVGPVRAIGRCWRLSRRRVGRAAALVAALFVVSSAVGLVLSFGQRALSEFLAGGGTWSWALAGALAFVVSMVVVPLQAAVAVLHYYDLRSRAEGLDLQTDVDSVFGRDVR